MLENLSQTHNKPILFTEVGYKSEASATVRPWEWSSFFGMLYRKKSDNTQQWLIKHYLKNYGAENGLQVCISGNGIPELHLLVRPKA